MYMKVSKYHFCNEMDPNINVLIHINEFPITLEIERDLMDGINTAKQVECLAALCRAYVEVLFGGQSAFTSE